MRRLIEIEWLKNRHYRTFWVVIGVYFLVLGFVCSNGKQVLAFLERKGIKYEQFKPTMLPIYDFPDVWQNITYMASFFKIFLAFGIIISITNENSYRTIRQNIIDGLSKKDFIFSKVGFIFLLSLLDSTFLFLLSLLMGFWHSSVTDFRSISQTIFFIPAHFLEVCTYLVFALLVGLLLKKSGLSIVLLLVYTLIIEPILGAILLREHDWVARFLPIKALNNLIPSPFPRYLFQEIQDYVAWDAILIVMAHLVIYIFLCYRLLAKRDL
ncbi:MAG: ABC transporter permease [Bacteroidota bacterium]